MELLANVGTWGHTLFYWVIPFLFILTIVVFFHELGHFLIARWCGVRVLVFSVGFGRELIGFTDRHGTRWKLAAIPLGGYVKFFGDENAASVPDQDALATMNETERRVSFPHKPVGQRAAIVAAGPIANFVLAIVLFAAFFAFYGKPTAPALVDAVQPGSAAEAAGFRDGDLVLSIDGRKIETFTDMQRLVMDSAGQTLRIVVERDGKEQTLVAVPKLVEIKNALGFKHRQGVLGLRGKPGPLETVDPVTAVKLGASESWMVVERTLSYIRGVFVGRESLDQLGGPIMIAQASRQVATAGFFPLLHFAGVVSISIGFLNLFPIPLLDGGHLLYYGIEAVRGRPLSERAQEYGFRIGLAIVLMLMIFTTFQDILRSIPWIS
jgi:regulator of sigma E protease